LELVESAQERDQRLVWNGKKKIEVKDMSGQWLYRRQRVSKKNAAGKKVNQFPLDAFFGERKRGRGYVSKNLEEKSVKNAMEQSYRQSERSGKNLLGRESIRRKTIEAGKKAATLEQTKKIPEIVTEQKTKDAENAKDTYKGSKGSRIRAILGKIFGWERLYLMVDGVGVQAQDRKKKGNTESQGAWIGSKECKVGGLLSQQGEQIRELGTFCTWARVDGFRRLVEWTMLSAIGIAGLFAEVVIVSDGAKWIRNMRKKIPFLKSAIWILDWFHVKDRLEACLRALEIVLSRNISEIFCGMENGKKQKKRFKKSH
jgi:hypothetical protein